MGPTGHHLPPSPLQNSEDFEETSEHSSCPDALKVAIPDTPIVALRKELMQPEGATCAGQTENDEHTHINRQQPL